MPESVVFLTMMFSAATTEMPCRRGADAESEPFRGLLQGLYINNSNHENNRRAAENNRCQICT